MTKQIMRKGGIKPTERTSAGLREVLFEAMDNLRNGEIEPTEAKALASVAQTICATVALEISVQKLRAMYPADAKFVVPKPLQLGTEEKDNGAVPPLRAVT